MDLQSLYDKTEPLSILKYSEQLIDKTFDQVLLRSSAKNKQSTV